MLVTNLVGNRIREIRAKRNLTQQQLSDRAHIPRATLATMERDNANPSLASVYRIAVALGTTIDDLLEQQHDRIDVVRADQMSRAESGDHHYRAITISPTTNPAFYQLHFRLDPHSSFVGNPHQPGSQEYLYILEGRVLLEVSGEKADLHVGDSAHFMGNTQHTYHNPGTSTAHAIVTIVELPEL